MTSPIDLACLADCKTWLGLTSTADDALLAGLITSVSQAISADLGRAILPATHTDALDGGGQASLSLRQWPVTSVASCSVDGVQIVASTRVGQRGFVLEGGDPSPPGTMQCLALRENVFPRGVQNVVITYRAGYEILGEAVTVPASGPYVVQALAPFGP